jgi:hypothetical protein
MQGVSAELQYIPSSHYGPDQNKIFWATHGCQHDLRNRPKRQWSSLLRDVGLYILITLGNYLFPSPFTRMSRTGLISSFSWLLRKLAVSRPLECVAGGSTTRRSSIHTRLQSVFLRRMCWSFYIYWKILQGLCRLWHIVYEFNANRFMF